MDEIQTDYHTVQVLLGSGMPLTAIVVREDMKKIYGKNFIACDLVPFPKGLKLPDNVFLQLCLETYLLIVHSKKNECVRMET